MMNLRAGWRLFFLVFSLAICSGCFQFSQDSIEEEKDPNFLEGKKRLNSLDYSGAIEYFEKALQANPRSAAAHFELGILYEQKVNDYGAAIYHYQRHLQLRPNSPMAEVVKQRITACKLELAKTVSFAVVNREVQRDLEKLSSTNALLKKELETVQAELASRPQYVTNFITNTIVTTQYVASAAADRVQDRVAKPAQTETSRSPKETRRTNSYSQGTTKSVGKATHTVQRGETMAAIARHYGISIERLQSANPRINPRKLLVGQTVVIPTGRD